MKLFKSDEDRSNVKLHVLLRWLERILIQLTAWNVVENKAEIVCVLKGKLAVAKHIALVAYDLNMF